MADGAGVVDEDAVLPVPATRPVGGGRRGHTSVLGALVVIVVVLGTALVAHPHVPGWLSLLVLAAADVVMALRLHRLGRSRGDLESLNALSLRFAGRLDAAATAHALLEGALAGGGFRRGVVLAGSDGSLPLLASYGLDPATAEAPGRPSTSPLVSQVCAGPGMALARGVDAPGEPWLATLLPGARTLVVVPLVVDRQPLGALVLEPAGPPRTDPRTRSFLEGAAAHASLALRTIWLLEQAERLAATDGLTKIANRRTFQSTLERELARASREGQDVSLVMIDLDHFKELNDTLGHPAGDEVLRNVAAALACACRDFDSPARYGGEEFAVVLPGCGPGQALELAERLRRAVSAAPSQVPVTASAGVATFPAQAGDVEALIAAADRALYASKRAGRDRTTASGGLATEVALAELRWRRVAQRIERDRSDRRAVPAGVDDCP